MGRAGSMFKEPCESSIRCLDYFGRVDPHARQYSLIVQSLLNLTASHVKRRQRELQLRRKQASSELFGLPAADAGPTSDRPADSHVPNPSEPVTSYDSETSTGVTAPVDWTMYDADFFALPWPTEYDPGLQDFLQPGTHNSDGASVADIPLFPIYDQQIDPSFRS